MARYLKRGQDASTVAAVDARTRATVEAILADVEARHVRRAPRGPQRSLPDADRRPVRQVRQPDPAGAGPKPRGIAQAELVQTPGRVRVDDATGATGGDEAREARALLVRPDRVDAARDADPQHAAVLGRELLRRIRDHARVEVRRPRERRAAGGGRAGDAVRAVGDEVRVVEVAHVARAERRDDQASDRGTAGSFPAAWPRPPCSRRPARALARFGRAAPSRTGSGPTAAPVRPSLRRQGRWPTGTSTWP